ncbi:hypothetical protein V5O48_007890 [Marasmius crinis-equi]|uniref:60S ribosomal protein L19 n=1 Tax=Marasmius crinis-equi TaxID=585013 RepID=A0ABR3FFK7_9AGAR
MAFIANSWSENHLKLAKDPSENNWTKIKPGRRRLIHVGKFRIRRPTVKELCNKHRIHGNYDYTCMYKKMAKEAEVIRRRSSGACVTKKILQHNKTTRKRRLGKGKSRVKTARD